MAVSGSLGVMLSLQVREKLIFQVGDENLSHRSYWCTLSPHDQWLCVFAQLHLTLCYSRAIAHRLLCPWNFPGRNTGTGCHFFLQGIFPTQNLHFLSLLCCGRILYHWATREAKGFWLCLMTKLLLFDVLCFLLFLHFLTSMIKLILWLKFFHRQKADRRHEGQNP